MISLYRCSSEGPVNNGLLKECSFEFRFEDGPHNCPVCGDPMTRIPDGKTIVELLQLGRDKYPLK